MGGRGKGGGGGSVHEREKGQEKSPDDDEDDDDVGGGSNRGGAPWGALSRRLIKLPARRRHWGHFRAHSEAVPGDCGGSERPLEGRAAPTTTIGKI